MPMVGSYLTKIGYQLHRYIKGVPEILLRIGLGYSRKSKSNGDEKTNTFPIYHILFPEVRLSIFVPVEVGHKIGN
jgi:hypothetical protein